MGHQTQGKALDAMVGDLEQPEDGAGGQGADDAGDGHRAGGEGDKAAGGLHHLHGNRGGDGFGGQRAHHLRRGAQPPGQPHGDGGGDKGAQHGGDQDWREYAAYGV